MITLPVSDVDRARRFYLDQVGFALDVDYAPTDAFRVVQLTPPGSGCSIQLGIGLTNAPAGSVRNTYLIVGDLETTRAGLLERGVRVSEIRHKTPIGAWDGGFAPGLDPDRGDYASFADFADPGRQHVGAPRTWLPATLGPIASRGCRASRGAVRQGRGARTIPATNAPGAARCESGRNARMSNREPAANSQPKRPRRWRPNPPGLAAAAAASGDPTGLRPDRESERWVEQLHHGHPRCDQAMSKLHELLLRVAFHYKNLFDARRNLRASVAAAGHPVLQKDAA